VDGAAGRTEILLRRQQQLETQEDYAHVVNNSTLSPRITWLELRQHQFKCFSKWLRNRYIEHRTDTSGTPFLFSEVIHFNFGIGERLDPTDNIVKTYRHDGVVWMHKILDPTETLVELDLRRKRGRKDLKHVNLETLNEDTIALSAQKRDDLRMLIKFLSQNGKMYYQNIIDKQ